MILRGPLLPSWLKFMSLAYLYSDMATVIAAPLDVGQRLMMEWTTLGTVAAFVASIDFEPYVQGYEDNSAEDKAPASSTPSCEPRTHNM